MRLYPRYAAIKIESPSSTNTSVPPLQIPEPPYEAEEQGEEGERHQDDHHIPHAATSDLDGRPSITR